MLKKRVLTILELNCNQHLGHREDKSERLPSYAHVVYTTAKQVISRRRKKENVCKISKDEICTCKACNKQLFIVKYANLWGLLPPSSLLAG